jgi:hypothetical protein
MNRTSLLYPIGSGVRLILLLLVVSSISTIPLFAQATKGSIVGTITDSSGAVVPGAEITIKEINTNIPRSATSNESGHYSFEILNPGTYRVEARLKGFKTAVVDKVVVLVNTTQRADLQLQVGAVSETVEVTAVAPLLQTDRSDVGRKIEMSQMQQLPISGRNRNFQMLWNLIPGATPVTREHSEFFNAQDSMATRVNGQGRYANNVQIEGVDNNQRTGLLTVLIPPIEALQTVDVTTSNYDAELGRAGGAVTNVVLKSGTNDFHGSAYEFNRVNYLFARNYFSATLAPHTVFNQFGATFGGPIRKDKTFFFADFMLIRSRVGNFNQWTVPTMAFRSGDFSAAPSIIYDPRTGTPDGKNRTPFLNNRIPDDRISPIAKRLLAMIPPPTQSTLTNNWQGPTVLSKDTNAFDAKVDHRLGQWDSLSVRYDYSRPRVFDPGAYGNLAGGPRSGGFAGEGIQKAQSGAINYTHIFNPRFIADFRFGVMRYRNDAKNQDSGSQASDQIGIKGVNLDWFTSGLTGIDVSGFGNPIVGFSPSLPWIRAETNFNFVSNWTRIKGNHTIKWGVDFRRNRDDLLQTQTYSPRGLWRFREGQTGLNGDPKTSFGNSFASFLLDLPNDYGRDLPGIFPAFRQSQLFSYIQDKWQVSSKLTVDLGVRHEIYFTPTTPQRAGFSNYDPNTNSLILSGVGSNPGNLGIETPLKNFAPRLGIAYRFTDKTVIRAAFGLAFDPAYPDDKWAYNYPVKQNNAFNAANSYVAAGSMAAGFPAPLPVTIPDSGVIQNAPNQNYIYIPSDLRQGYLETWNIAIQRQLPGNFAFEVAYVGNHTVGTLNNVNINAGQTPGLGSNGQPLKIKYGLTGSVTKWTRFSMSYNGLQMKLDRRYGNGLGITTSYTFSKALDYATDNGGLGIPINFSRNRGRSNQDRTHMYVQSFIYELPVGIGKRWLSSGWAGKLLGGWQFNGAFSAYSGTPMTFSYSASGLNAPGNSQRTNISGTPVILGNIGPGQQWLDKSVFSIPATATFGNAGRNTFSGPGFWNLDMSLIKRFVMSERFKSELRLETFNLTNTPHFNNPSSALDSTAFGQVTSAFGERQVQLGFKLVF